MKIGLLLLLALLAACGKAPVPPLRVGVNPWVGYDPLVLAQERHLFDNAQLRVVELASNTESQRALRNGLLDAAALTLDEALRLADAGVALKIVAVLDISQGADAVLARSGIAHPSQLKGRRIALEQGALGALVLDRLLLAGGLSADAVQLVRAEAAQHEAMLVGARADAVITFEPIKSRLLAQGYKSIFDSRAMPGEIVDVLVVRAGIAASRVMPLLTAWERGRQALLATPQASADAAVLLAPGVDLTPEQYLATLRGLDFVPLADSVRRLGPEASGQPALLARDAAHLAATLQQLGLIRRPPDWRALLDAQPAAMSLEAP